ncbi:hypothetical protein MJL48_15360, partial [Salmonella enterica subsp. enterica serovar Kentucky]|nr:hypothetical protein [Salmonella enterica subsp. enterica serovar Kentucky]
MLPHQLLVNFEHRFTLGGAGFPAHVKLQAQVEIFLVNAAE